MVAALLTTARTAHAVLAMERKLIDAFLKEAADLESFGHILHPTLFRQAQSEPWRDEINRMLRAAVAFDEAYVRMEQSLLQHMPEDQRQAFKLITEMTALRT